MHRLVLIGLVVLFSACENERGEDSAHRAVDWTSTLRLTLQLDTSQFGDRALTVLKCNSSNSLNAMVGQLYDMAFSGNAQVHAPTILGAIDPSVELNPKELYDFLEDFDTVTYEDIHTDALRDTVVDVSFTKGQVTAVSVRFSWNPTAINGSIEAHPDQIALGSLVFDEETARLRGVRNKFYIRSSKSSEEYQIDHLRFQSDSLAQFQLIQIWTYDDGSSRSLASFLMEKYPDVHRFDAELTLSLDLSAGRFYIESMTIQPLDVAS